MVRDLGGGQAPRTVEKVAILLIRFQNQPAPAFTRDAASAAFFGGHPSFSGFYAEASYGKLQLEGQVFGWVTLPYSSNEACTFTNERKWTATAKSIVESQQAVNFSDYRYTVSYVQFDGASSCERGHAYPQFKEAYVYDARLDLKVAIHEFGHLLGLEHSSFLGCRNPEDPLDVWPIGEIMNEDCILYPTSVSNPYEDYFDPQDVMGVGFLQSGMHFNAFQKSRLGWLAGNQITQVTTAGEYEIAPLELPSSEPQALGIARAGVPQDFQGLKYFVEFRQKLGNYDLFTNDLGPTQGVQIRLTHSNRSLLVDGTPATPYAGDHALPFGRTFRDEVSGLSIEAVGVRDGKAVVRVAFAAPVSGLTLANGASFRRETAAGSIGAIFGTNLASSVAENPSYADALGGSKVTFAGRPARLSYASPGQINLLVPSVPYGSRRVRVVDAATGKLRAVGHPLIQVVAPGIFTRDGTGAGLPSALTTVDGVNFLSVANPDGTPRPVRPSTAAAPNFLVLYGTGIQGPPSSPSTGIVSFRTLDGAYAKEVATGFVGGTEFLGLDQVNVRLPEDLPLGAEIWITITIPNGSADADSNSVFVRTAPAA